MATKVRVYQCETPREQIELPEDERATCESCEQKIDECDLSDNPNFTLHVACDERRRQQQESELADWRAWRRS